MLMWTSDVSSGSYRQDHVIVWNQRKKTFQLLPTENFGDVSVDKGAGVSYCVQFCCLSDAMRMARTARILAR